MHAWLYEILVATTANESIKQATADLSQSVSWDSNELFASYLDPEEDYDEF